MGGGAVRADILMAGFAALDAGRPCHGLGAKFHGNGDADLQSLSRIPAEQTDVNPCQLASHRQFKADTHSPIYLIQRKIKFQAPDDLDRRPGKYLRQRPQHHKRTTDFPRRADRG